MKKNFASFMMLFATVFTGLSFVSCSEDLQETSSDGDNTIVAQEVLFTDMDKSTSHSRLLTSMDSQGAFYWTSGDYIFVKNGSSYIPSNNSANSRVARTDFYLTGSFTEGEYKVVYTGNGKNQPSQATSVEVKDNQVQTVADNADHLGSCGDCGNASATRTSTGSYKFDLLHRAAYFVIAPRHTFSGKTVTLQKVEVTTSASEDLCGIYDFDETTETLKGKLSSGGKKTITLTTSNFPVPTIWDVENNDNRLADARGYIVFQPGTHTLTFKYYVTIGSEPREFTKTVTSREFKAGYFTNVKHILSDGKFDGGHLPLNLDDKDITDEAGSATPPIPFTIKYYQWDAQNPHGSATDTEYNTIGYPTNDSEIAAKSAQNSCKDMPNVNEMYWYIKNGDAHWDSTTVWTIDGGLTENTKGLWLKTKTTIQSEGKEFSSTTGMDGVDMRLNVKTHSFNTSKAALSAAERSKYFFLPALGYYNQTGTLSAMGEGRYWTSSPVPSSSYTGSAYYLFFDKSRVAVYYGYRYGGFPTDPQWFK